MKKKVLPVFALILSLFLSGRPFSIYADSDTFDSVNYDLVDYVSPNGSNVYINTGYKPNANTVINVVFSTTSNTSGRFLYGVASSSNSYGFNIGTAYRVRTLNGTSNINLDGIFPVNTIVTVNQGLSVTTATDGNTTYSASYTQGNSSLTSNMYIFCLNASGSTTNFLTGAKLYDFKIYESSSLVHHYYPCKRKSDNVVGVYDGITNIFISGSGGSLSYGSVVSNNYTITTAVSPSGSGTVSGGGTYASGTTITLTATAYSGYVFSNWSDNDTSNPRSVTVTADTTYTAVFEQEATPTPSYTVSLSVSPTGSGTVSGSGSYSSGTSVVISAAAGTGYEFVKWSDDSTSNPRTLVVSDDVSLTAIFQEQSSTTDPDPDVPSSWINWTDEDDQEYLEDITLSVDLNKIYWRTSIYRIIESVNIFGTQIEASTYTPTALQHVAFLGSYFDNTITGVTGCNSSSYNYSTSSSTQVNVTTITPAIYGQFDSNINSDEGLLFDFGIKLNAGSSSQVSATTSGFVNTTEACRLIGMNDGDGSIDGTTLLAAGYEKKTITYNDGSTNGHTATFYVPGDEEFSFAADLSFLEDLLDNLLLDIRNYGEIYYYEEYILSLHGKDGYLLSEYGSAESRAFIGFILNQGYFGNITKTFNLLPSDNTYAHINNTFNYNVYGSTTYSQNITYLYWQGTRNPVWKFKTGLTRTDFTPKTVSFNFYEPLVNDSYGYQVGIGSSYTVTSSDVALYPNLTEGYLIYTNLNGMNFYQYKNSALLNRFNQLGSFLNNWFSRIYQSIGNITGGNESNEIINNIVNDYDISVETDFNGLLQNVENYREDIDLSLPEFNLPSSDVSGIQSLAGSFKDIYEEVYINNGLGILVFVPLLLLVLRLIL